MHFPCFFLLSKEHFSDIINLLCGARRKGLMLMLRKWIPIALIALAVLAAGAVYMFQYGKEDDLVFKERTEETEEGLPAREDLPADPEGSAGSGEAVSADPQGAAVCVHVCGSVREEGIYFLSADARVADAVEAAGGFADDASTTYLNLAAKLSDGMKVYVPSVEELADGSFPDVGGATVADTGQNAGESGKININTADLQQLMTLPGIGENRAGEIIAWREKHGGFSEISDIMKVSGIKDAMFEKLKDRICVR